MNNSLLYLRETEEKEKELLLLYKKAFPVVARFIKKRGGTYEDAKDIFQDAVIIYFEKISDLSFNLNKDDTSYVLGIAKHLWLQRFRKYTDTHKGLAPIDDVIDEVGYVEASTSKLLQALESAGQKCMKLLQAFYYNNLSMNEVANQFGFRGTRSATVQKYKCLEKVRDKVKEKSLCYEDFLE